MEWFEWIRIHEIFLNLKHDFYSFSGCSLSDREEGEGCSAPGIGEIFP
jgi:hypothetical protein